MQNNLDKYRNDLNKLTKSGDLLQMAIECECFPERYKKALGEKAEEVLQTLPKFCDEYQSWYSQAKAVIKQLLPDRLDDFVRYYEKPKSRKDINYESYRIEDYLQGLSLTRGHERQKVVGPDAAIKQFKQQLAILKSVSVRLESSLFEIKQLVQADLFDSELEAALSLVKYGFLRSAGAIAGVVLEKHLAQVADNHNLKTGKKHPTISDFNELLKNEDVLDLVSWRQIQRLADIRNICAHNKDRDPTKEEVEELVRGVEKFTKTLY